MQNEAVTILTSMTPFAREGKIRDLLLIADVEGVGVVVTNCSNSPGGSPRLVGLLEMLKYHYIYQNLPEN